jgi:(R)-2-hydroxyacyl-CoA dehydratese activating ATPase
MAPWSMGVDVGSLTAKGVLLADGAVAASFLCPAAPSVAQSIAAVVDALCARGAVARAQVGATCLTGYRRLQAPFPALEKTEISCHALGAFVVEPAARTVIDIGGQDCKVIALDERGRVQEFAMNDKCAAGTGRALEVLARSLGIHVQLLGGLALEGRPGRAISSRCTLFMEEEVLEARRAGVDRARIARAIVEAVVERVLGLASKVPLRPGVCLTGGVAKNSGVVAAFERKLGQPLSPLRFDPQLVGALGAAHFAMAEGRA